LAKWEKGQATDPNHVERLLVDMLLATWIVLCIGSQVAQEILSQPSSGKRCTRPYKDKFSLFTLGLERLLHCLIGNLHFNPSWSLLEWDAKNWQTQIRSHHALAFLWAT
jgi:hypothetical protein